MAQFMSLSKQQLELLEDDNTEGELCLLKLWKVATPLPS